MSALAGWTSKLRKLASPPDPAPLHAAAERAARAANVRYARTGMAVRANVVREGNRARIRLVSFGRLRSGPVGGPSPQAVLREEVDRQLPRLRADLAEAVTRRLA